MGNPARTYLPAAGREWLLPLYDPLAKLFGVDSARRELLTHAAIRPGHRILDIGCGTGTILVTIKRLYPSVDVVGVDPDPKALARARQKAARAAVTARLDQGFADELPYPTASFDRVLSSLMFHHLRPEERPRMLREARRVLKPGGSLHMLDFVGSALGPHGIHGFLARRLRPGSHSENHFEDRILALLSEAGFTEPKVVSRRPASFGRVAYYQASVRSV